MMIAKYFKYDEEYNLIPIYDDNVVEVVRCKDCKYSVCIPNYIGEDWFCDLKYNEWGEPWVTSPDGFCNGGERREAE